MTQTNNSDAFLKAKNFIPGGVNSPVRAFNAVGGTPKFIDSAKGAYLFDIENKKYIDYVGSWGPMILGHADQRVLDAVQKTMQKGLSFGAPTELETELAEMIVNRIPYVDMVRMCNSGTEATMSAIRLARGYTKRNIIIKFEGCYHGHSDSLLVKAGSGALTFGVPTSPGVPSDFAKYTLTLTYNDPEAVKAAFNQYKNEIAAVIVEPIAGNMNMVIPDQTFIQEIRNQCDQHGAVFISDEVMTGFRVAYSGASELLDFTPDLVTYGKVIGGGMPVGAFGGKKEIMSQLSPLGGVYQAGTLSGNPVAMIAGITTLKLTDQVNFYSDLYQKTEFLVTGLKQAAKETNTDLLINYRCGMFGLFFTDKKSVRCFSDVMSCDSQKFAKFFHAMLDQGVYLAPAAFEAGFVSIAHSEKDLLQTISAAKTAFQKLS